jgi:hypothetical protein
MSFRTYLTEETTNENELLEALSKKWKQIIDNLDKVQDAGYVNRAGELDLAWYGKSHGIINYATTTKGTLYRIKGEDWMFYTAFQPNTDLKVVYTDNEGSAEDREIIKLTTLTKMMVKAKAWKGRPVQINGKKTSKYVTFQKNNQWRTQWDFVFADGMTVPVNTYDREPAAAKATILNKIDEIESWGYKIAKKVQPDLERLLPELFGDTGFALDDTIWLNANKIDKTPEFLEFINTSDNESRTGHGIKFKKDGILVHGLIGNTSDGFRSEHFKYKKVPTNFKEFKKFMVDSGAIKYTIALQKARKEESDRYRNYMANGGAID